MSQSDTFFTTRKTRFYDVIFATAHFLNANLYSKHARINFAILYHLLMRFGWG